MEFKEFKPRFKSAKTRFKSWNIWYNFKWNQPYLNRGLNLNRRSNSLIRPLQVLFWALVKANWSKRFYLIQFRCFWKIFFSFHDFFLTLRHGSLYTPLSFFKLRILQFKMLKKPYCATSRVHQSQRSSDEEIIRNHFKLNLNSRIRIRNICGKISTNIKENIFFQDKCPKLRPATIFYHLSMKLNHEIIVKKRKCSEMILFVVKICLG